MRDPALEKAYAGISPFLYHEDDRPKRCPSCFAPMWPAFARAWQSTVRDLGFRDRVVHVVTCASHYCRSRAREFARFDA